MLVLKQLFDKEFQSQSEIHEKLVQEKLKKHLEL